MADKASRAVLLYGDGLARFLNPSHTHIHSLASLACCGFLALPHSPSSSENEGARMIREFAELLDACEAYTDANAEESTQATSEKECLIPTISERFMGTKAAVISNNSSLKGFGGKLGLTILQFNELIGSNHSVAESPLLASEMLKLLGFQDGKTFDISQFDLLFVHMGAGEEPNGLTDIEQVNGLVGALMHLSQSGSEIGSRLHLSLLMSYGAVSGDDSSKFSLPVTKHDTSCELSVLFPRQSYTMKGGKIRENVRQHSPILIAQWQSAVTRKDMVETYSFGDFKENGGNLVIPADRFLHEVAFKLWKAPKYGA